MEIYEKKQGEVVGEDKLENKFKQYTNWVKVIRQKCDERTFVENEYLTSKDSDVYEHYKLDNNLHVYISNPKAGETKLWIFDGPNMLKYGGTMQRSICIDEISESDFYNMVLEFTVGNVKSSDDVPGYITYQEDMEEGVAFLPDKSGRNGSVSGSGQPVYFDDNFDLSEDIKAKLEKAIKNTEDIELKSTYKKALEFYTKIHEIVNTKNKENDSKILEALRKRKGELEEEQGRLEEAERLIDAIDNQGHDLNE